MLLIALIIALSGWTSSVHSFYYPNNEQILFRAESTPYMVIDPRSDNGQFVIQPQSQLQQDLIFSQSESNAKAWSDDGNCQDGFVERCLIQVNQDGEQRLLEISTNNQTGRDDLINEFDGMCQVVIRFMECINKHYNKCNPMQPKNQQNTDVFYQSWSNMCASNSKTRNKYLQHGKCIKHALGHNNGQEQCQALFQSYFITSHYSMDSIEDTVQHGCCAFNEWQYCIDSLIQKQCGSEATQAIQDLIDQASGGLVSSLCEKKIFGRKSRTCMGKKKHKYNKLQMLDPKMNATLQKYITILGDFIDRLPDDDEEESVNSK